MKNNRLKRIACALLALVTLSGTLLLSGCGKGVNTYSVQELAYVDSWLDSSESYGEVKAVNMQNVYASDYMDVKEIFVKEGQQVKKGDKLLSYDTSLSDIELEKKELEVMSLELEIEQAKKELAEINSYKPMVVTVIKPTVSEEGEGTPVSGCFLKSGSGTRMDPCIFVVENGVVPCSSEFFASICPEGMTDAWMVFQKREGNMSNGTITDYWGICYSNLESGPVMQFFDASAFCKNPITEPYEEIEYNSGLTAAEISQLRQSTKDKIRDTEYKHRMADLEYQQMKLEKDGGIVTAELNGIVELVNDAQTAFETGEPIIRVSNGGGFVVEGTLSELELSTVSVGQTVKITSWENYGEYEAEISSISTVPAAQNGWTNGNSNVSYYPFTVYIDQSANLKEHEYVSVVYSSKGYSSDGFYLEKPFILQENDGSYVFVQTEEGTLEKRRIETGESLWGTYLRVVSGLTVDDRIAFPYGKDVKNGAPAVEAGLEELYEYY